MCAKWDLCDDEVTKGHTLTIALPARIYQVPESWVMDIMDRDLTEPGKMKGRKKGCSSSSAFVLLLLCVTGHATIESEASEEEDIVGAALPPLILGHSVCAMKADDGPCKAIHIRYFFNIQSQLSGKTVVAQIKKEKPDFCFHEKDPGVCRGYFTRYFYNKETKSCEAFKYGGCLGNQNNFKSLEECQSTCQENSNLLPIVTVEEYPNTVNSSSPAEESNQVPGIFGNNLLLLFIVNPLKQMLLGLSSHFPIYLKTLNLLPTAPNEKSNTLNGSSRKERNQFPISFEPPPIPSLCLTPMDRGLCRAKELRFFYNYSTGRCRPFSYSGCGGNENNFTSKKSCLRICKKGPNEFISLGLVGGGQISLARYVKGQAQWSTLFNKAASECFASGFRAPAFIRGAELQPPWGKLYALMGVFISLCIPLNMKNDRIIGIGFYNQKFYSQFEFVQLQHKIHCTGYKNEKKLDHIFALLISYYGLYMFAGPYCNRTWDGWLCWSDVAAGTVSVQRCPDYFQDFNPSEKVTKICDPNGNWFRHPESNRTWTNYTQCNSYTHEKVKVSCKVSQFIYLYLMGCNYFWMLCEGIYLHTLIVVAVFAEKQHLMWYYLLGWGFPLIPACIHAVARTLYYNDNCWISSDTHLLYIIHGPICAALLVNLFFLLNIVRVLITKLKDTHRAESNLYMKAVRATLILVPLLGIEFVLFPWRPEGRIAEEVYDYVMHILMHYQGLLVATIFCFFNGEVQAVLRRHWNQYKIQFEHSFSHSDAMRTASYTVSTISDVPGYSYSHDCTSEHLNGKGYHDMDSVVLKTEKLYG
ncbi:hypothetical protein WISP_12839 [Willisornis vidua]|uniref:CALRL protein n=1 Tax=Willisornis vidua TaxID=1566151 RepID=A0ABQ9DW53_9PASS|nr:hypothetical protein WISP_12839 [Willisornis vidua]